ncbi:hypothetical protein DH2020_039939 [Rehmannia glutinosa]|uniref:Late embryogenesis abundant protein ECP63-like domain-containing protein n=1 Tax=Rehmannia glutinosa TaxID=99300 RepID=A0ABR0UUC1_REHGL
MASRQTAKEERAEAAARTAAEELSDVNRERREREIEVKVEKQPEYFHQTVGGMKKKHRPVQGMRRRRPERQKTPPPRMAKDTTAGKLGEYKDYTAEKAKETKDTTVGKVGEYKDYAAEKAKETKDATMQKAGEYKDYAADKAKQAKDTTMEKATEAKDTTMDKAKQAKDTTVEKAAEAKDTTMEKAGLGGRRGSESYGLLDGEKEETKQHAIETGEAAKEKTGETMGAAKEKYDETKEEARRKMEEMKIEGEAKRSEAESERGSETAASGGGGGGIFGALGAIKDKLTPHPAEKREEQGSRVSYGAAGEPKTGHRLAVDEEGTPVVMAVDVEETPGGAAAAALKYSDQVTGQAFNDVGRMDEEVVTRVRLDRPGKM